MRQKWQRSEPLGMTDRHIADSQAALLKRCRMALSYFPQFKDLVEDVLSFEKLIDEQRNPKPKPDMALLFPDRKEERSPKRARGRSRILDELMEPDPVMGRLGKAAPFASAEVSTTADDLATEDVDQDEVGALH